MLHSKVIFKSLEGPDISAQVDLKFNPCAADG